MNLFIYFFKKIKNFKNVFERKFNEKINKKFELLIKYLIFFIFKKNKTFYLYIDYRKLNNITIKNRYLLFNINEL